MRLLREMLLALTLLVLALVASCTGCVAWMSRNGPDRVERFGSLDVVTHTIGYVAGWNEGRLRRATTEQYSLRHGGAPLVIRGRAGFSGDETAEYRRVNAVVTFPGAPEPAVVVNVGDPNNSSWFYLVRGRAGAPVVEYLGESRGGVSADWLDAPPGDSAVERDVALHRGRLPAGGRWLLLGEQTVLDTRTLTRYAVTPPRGASPNQFKRPIAMSPDSGSFVRWGSTHPPENAPRLLVYDFTRDLIYLLPVDRAVMRYNEWEEIDAAWVDHHFEWRREPDGRDRLVRRARFAPLPYRGVRRHDGADGYREYDLIRVRPEMYERLTTFLVAELGATRLPRGREMPAVPTVDDYVSDEFRIGDRVVHTSFHEDQVGVWMDRGTDSALVDEIARRFDAALRTGAHDALFLP